MGYRFNDGVRLRYWVDHNSVKIYNEQNNLRVETTINNPGKFKVFRHKQGQDKNETKQRLPMRKGVMDVPLRASVAQDVNNRLMNDLSSVSFGSGRTDKQLSAKVSRHLKSLRVHGIIRKPPRQDRYQVTIIGMQLAKALNALLAASTDNLLKMAT